MTAIPLAAESGHAAIPFALVPAIGFIAAYLCGSIPFGWLIGKARGVDIRLFGSKNIGATNCGRVCGTPWGVLAFVLDVAKGFLPVLAAVTIVPRLYGGSSPHGVWLACVIVAFGPIVGHVFPVWLKFKGGKAVATSLGVVFAFPMVRWVGLAAFGLWIIVFLLTRYVSLASTVGALGLLAGYLVFERDQTWGDHLPVTIFLLALVSLVLLRHRSNYLRLIEGTENRFGTPERQPPADQIELDQEASVRPPQAGRK